jgi:hypothetical protein
MTAMTKMNLRGTDGQANAEGQTRGDEHEKKRNQRHVYDEVTIPASR